MFDRRKSYYLTIDTETANNLDNPIVFDIGGAVHDKKGNVAFLGVSRSHYVGGA